MAFTRNQLLITIIGLFAIMLFVGSRNVTPPPQYNNNNNRNQELQQPTHQDIQISQLSNQLTRVLEELETLKSANKKLLEQQQQQSSSLPLARTDLPPKSSDHKETPLWKWRSNVDKAVPYWYSRAEPDPKKLKMMFEVNKKSWESMGAQDPWWSVLTNFEKGKTIPEERISEFYAKGVTHVSLAKEILTRNGHKWGTGKALDWGCGLGRMSIALAPHFDKVVGVDQSQPHLNIAKEQSVKRGASNAEFHRTEMDLLFLGEETFDFIYSIIALQHVIPPLQRNYIEQFCRLLKPGRAGFFQVMTKIDNYVWDPEKIERWTSGGMQMHAIPQQEVIEALMDNGCYMVENYHKMDAAGVPAWDTGFFVFAKPISR